MPEERVVELTPEPSLVVPDENAGEEQWRQFAIKLHTSAQACKEVATLGMYELAVRLHLIREKHLWKYVDGSVRSFEEYLEVYGFGDWSRGKAFALLGQVKELLRLGVPPNEVPRMLAQVGWTKFEVVRPALQTGRVPLEQALNDARALGRRDLIRKYEEVMKREGEARLSCHDCPALCRGDEARGDRLLAVLRGQLPGVPVTDVPWRYCMLRKIVWIDGPNVSEAQMTFDACAQSPLKKQGIEHEVKV